jgi:hypothetical protein
MGRFPLMVLVATVAVTGIATLAVAESDLDLHTGHPPIVRPSPLHGFHEKGFHQPEFHHFRRHEFVGVPFIFFDDEMPEYEPYFEVATPSPSPSPSPPLPTPQPCSPGPREKTFTTEVSNGVQIIRGHSDQCAR